MLTCARCDDAMIRTRQVILTDVTQATPTNFKISTDKKGYFYHQAAWHDMNGDGKLDVIAARATVPTIPTPWSKAKGDLLWMEHPSSGGKRKPIISIPPNPAFLL